MKKTFFSVLSLGLLTAMPMTVIACGKVDKIVHNTTIQMVFENNKEVILNLLKTQDGYFNKSLNIDNWNAYKNTSISILKDYFNNNLYVQNNKDTDIQVKVSNEDKLDFDLWTVSPSFEVRDMKSSNSEDNIIFSLDVANNFNGAERNGTVNALFTDDVPLENTIVVDGANDIFPNGLGLESVILLDYAVRYQTAEQSKLDEQIKIISEKFIKFFENDSSISENLLTPEINFSRKDAIEIDGSDLWEHDMNLEIKYTNKVNLNLNFSYSAKKL